MKHISNELFNGDPDLIRLRKRAEQGAGLDLFRLGKWYYENGTEQDYEEAVKWFKKAAKQYNDDGQYWLGLCYYNGHGVNQDYVEAFKWFQKAAKWNNHARRWLGLCYFKGEGVKQSFEEAVKWFRYAAKWDDALSQVLLGLCYSSGKGVKKNSTSAARWIQKAAQRNQVFSLFAQKFFHGDKIASDEQIPQFLSFMNSYIMKRQDTPERIQRMRNMVTTSAFNVTAGIFRRQGLFMADYDDEMPWNGDFFCYSSTYQNLTNEQLRGYFHWRGCIRRGEFQPSPASVAYIYINELLNGIGTKSPEESLNRLQEFEIGYLDSGIGDEKIRKNLRPWMMSFAMIYAQPLTIVLQYIDPNILSDDKAINTLHYSDQHGDDDIFQALCQLAGKKLATSPALSGQLADKGKKMLCKIWKTTIARFHSEGKDLFLLCFGEKKTSQWWSPLNGAMIDWDAIPKTKDIEYIIDECRIYRCRGGNWEEECYHYDKERFLSFIHAADLRMRRYMGTGPYLRETPFDKWILPYIDEVIKTIND